MNYKPGPLHIRAEGWTDEEVAIAAIKEAIPAEEHAKALRCFAQWAREDMERMRKDPVINPLLPEDGPTELSYGEALLMAVETAFDNDNYNHPLYIHRDASNTIFAWQIDSLDAVAAE